MIVRELSYILNRVPSDGYVKFRVDGPGKYKVFHTVNNVVWDTFDGDLILSGDARVWRSPTSRNLSGIRPGNQDLQILFLAAFRYALGRKMYVVPTVAGMIRENIDYLTRDIINLMIREIEDEEDRGGLGMDVDREIWLRLRSELELKVSIPIDSNELE